MRRPGFDAFMGVVVGALGALGALGAFGPGGFRLVPTSAVSTALVIAALAVLRLLYRRRDPRLRTMLGVMLWASALSNVYLLPMYALTRLGAPLRDDLGRVADRALGLDVVVVAARVQARPWLARASELVYDSLQPFCLVSLMVAALAGQGRRAERGVLALVLASVLSLPLHGLAPAIGPWTHAPSALAAQRATSEVYRHIRSGESLVINLAAPDALVAFPSWHVLLAVLAAAVLAGIRALAPVAVVWAALITVSTVLTGWHYGVDVLGALALAATSFTGAAALQRWLSTTEP